MRFIALSTLLAAGCLLLGGCSSGPAMSEVEGVLTVAGKPLDKIQIEFWPEVDGPRSYGVTDNKGHYSLMSDDGKRAGAVVGAHRVVLRDIGIWGDKVLGRDAENVDLAKGKKPRISGEYGDSLKTPVRKTVTAGAKNTINIEL